MLGSLSLNFAAPFGIVDNDMASQYTKSAENFQKTSALSMGTFVSLDRLVIGCLVSDAARDQALEFLEAFALAQLLRNDTIRLSLEEAFYYQSR
jgi:hypothetical protein